MSRRNKRIYISKIIGFGTYEGERFFSEPIGAARYILKKGWEVYIRVYKNWIHFYYYTPIDKYMIIKEIYLDSEKTGKIVFNEKIIDYFYSKFIKKLPR